VEVKTMKGCILAGFFGCSLFFVVGGDAQSRNTEKAVWTLEFIKVRPENFGPAMGYLDDHWMGVRAEAKNRGAVLDYHIVQNALIQNTGLVRPGEKVDDLRSIVLLTEYKNMDAFMESQKVFAAMREHTNWQTGGVVRTRRLEDLVAGLNTQVFVEEPETTPGFKLLTKETGSGFKLFTVQ